MKRYLGALVFMFISVAQAPSAQGGDDYTVEGGGTYKAPDGVPPAPTCVKSCDPAYNTCAADCFRGAVESFMGCMASCEAYCQTTCTPTPK
jgi:hypothetical protein